MVRLLIACMHQRELEERKKSRDVEDVLNRMSSLSMGNPRSSADAAYSGTNQDCNFQARAAAEARAKGDGEGGGGSSRPTSGAGG